MHAERVLTWSSLALHSGEFDATALKEKHTNDMNN